ncbi:hypothetical protein Tco_0635334 [Tanacetum coccineum]
MISCSISGLGQAPEKVTGVDLFYLRSMDQWTANVPYLLAQYLFRHAEGRKSGASGARLSGVTSLGVLQHILDRPETREAPDAAAGAFGAAEDAPAADEGARANPAPVQAPQPPPPAPKTIQQRVSRLEEEVQELRQSIVGLRGDVARSITDQSRFSTWMVSCMTQLMDASGRTYQAFDSTLDAIRRILGFGIRRIDLLYRPCCKEIDDMVYSEKGVCTSILMPRQRTFVQELKLENHPEQHIRGVPSSNYISHFL